MTKPTQEQLELVRSELHSSMAGEPAESHWAKVDQAVLAILNDYERLRALEGSISIRAQIEGILVSEFEDGWEYQGGTLSSSEIWAKVHRVIDETNTLLLFQEPKS